MGVSRRRERRGLSEADAFGLVDGLLEQHTIGFASGSGGHNYYNYALNLTGQQDFTYTIVASIPEYQSFSNPYGFDIGFVAGGFGYYVGVAGPQYGYGTTGGTTYGDFAPGFDPAAFNTYTITGRNGLVGFKVNGVALVTDEVAEARPGDTDALLFGDGTGGGNARVRISSFAFTTDAVPEPATWATMLLGFALAGGAMRRRGVAAVRAG